MSSRTRGFTAIEMVTVLAIVATVGALAAIGLSRSRPRAGLATTAAELHALLRNARQNALNTGRPTIVIVFPSFQNPAGGTGRVVVLEEPSATFFQESASPDDFESYMPGEAPTGNTEITSLLDLPRHVVVDLPAGDEITLSPPYDRITVEACGFCGGDRGAVRFDSKGRASFHSGNGAALDLWGSSLSLTAMEDEEQVLAGAVRTLVITSTTGSARTFVGG
jgi:prepilin-type N-terminal cleavage/methylation domain-containing protein